MPVAEPYLVGMCCLVTWVTCQAIEPVAAAESVVHHVEVTTIEELARALKDLRPGDIVNVAPGRYQTSATLRLRSTGTQEAPVVLRSVRNGEAEIAGTHGLLIEKSSHVTVDGFRFTHSSNSKAIEVKQSRDITISRNYFRLTENVEQQTHWVYLAGETSHCAILGNLFENKTQPGCFVTLDGTRSEDDATGEIVRHVQIAGNHFRNIGPRIKNGKEAVRLGSSKLSMSSSHALLEGNLFEGCDGDPEVVSVKCCDAVIRGNTFRDCHGGLCLRHGNRNVADANIFLCTAGKEGVGGIRVYGCDQTVTNNVMHLLTGKGDEGPLVLCHGETDAGPLDARFRPQRVLMAHNTLVECVHSSVDIGYDDGGKLKLPALDCLLANNLVISLSGTLVRQINDVPTLEIRGNLLLAGEKAKLGIDVNHPQVTGFDQVIAMVSGIPRLVSGSPAIDAGEPLPIDVEHDLDGQPRCGRGDVGADELSDASGTRRPLTSADVGPQGVWAVCR